MLVELHSPAFRSNGTERGIIKFHAGLNVILGQSNGANSIGKSTALLAIDFLFGGSTYNSEQIIKNVGYHTIYGCFEFNGCQTYVGRSTDKDNLYLYCNSQYDATGQTISKDDFVEWLQTQYGMNLPELGFRDSLSAAFRIYGKKNCDDKDPLLHRVGTGQENSLKAFAKIFDVYSVIAPFSEKKKESADALTTFNKAQGMQFIRSRIKSTAQREKYLKDKEILSRRFQELQAGDYSSPSREVLDEEDRRSALEAKIISINSQHVDLKRNLQLVELSMSYGLLPSAADLDALARFFPTVNLKAIYEVESFHRKLAGVLSENFKAEMSGLTDKIQELEDELFRLKSELEIIEPNATYSQGFLREYSSVQKNLEIITQEIDTWDKHENLVLEKNAAADALNRAFAEAVKNAVAQLNAELERLSARVSGADRNAPYLAVESATKYDFYTPDDDGTGTNYKGLILYDLALLNLTVLPAIAHDSFLLKDIEDPSIEQILALYQQSPKQIFLAFDKAGSYTSEAKTILQSNAVLELSRGGNELYGRSWNVKG